MFGKTSLSDWYLIDLHVWENLRMVEYGRNLNIRGKGRLAIGVNLMDRQIPISRNMHCRSNKSQAHLLLPQAPISCLQLLISSALPISTLLFSSISCSSEMSISWVFYPLPSLLFAIPLQLFLLLFFFLHFTFFFSSSSFSTIAKSTSNVFPNFNHFATLETRKHPQRNFFHLFSICWPSFHFKNFRPSQRGFFYIF